MENESERLEELCRMASVEPDSAKLLELTREINEILLRREAKMRKPLKILEDSE